MFDSENPIELIGTVKEFKYTNPHTFILLDVKDPRELANAAVWNVLSRPPEARELQAIASYLEQRSDRPTEAVRQVVWSLLTSTEFRFNH